MGLCFNDPHDLAQSILLFVCYGDYFDCCKYIFPVAGIGWLTFLFAAGNTRYAVLLFSFDYVEYVKHIKCLKLIKHLQFLHVELSAESM